MELILAIDTIVFNEKIVHSKVIIVLTLTNFVPIQGSNE